MQFLGIDCSNCGKFMAEAAVSQSQPLGAGPALPARASVWFKCPWCERVSEYQRANLVLREYRTEPPKMVLPPIIRNVRVNDHAVEHVEAARPIHRSMLRGILTMGFLVMALGLFAIYRGATADTTFDLYKVHLKTTHVGVAIVGIGLVVSLLAYSRILKSVETLAALPHDRDRT